MNTIKENFNWLELIIIPDEKMEWLLSTEQVAQALGTTEWNIREHKSSKSKELINGKHYTVRNPDGLLYWTKRGCTRLWFMVKSNKAILFRDWAEDYIIEWNKKLSLPWNYKEALLALVAKEEEKEKLLIENKQLVEKNLELKEDASFKHMVAGTGTEMKLWAFALMVNTSITRLNKWLLDRQYIRRHWNKYLPYTKFMNEWLFKVIESNFWDYTNYEILVTAKWRIILAYDFNKTDQLQII